MDLNTGGGGGKGVYGVFLYFFVFIVYFFKNFMSLNVLSNFQFDEEKFLFLLLFFCLYVLIGNGISSRFSRWGVLFISSALGLVTGVMMQFFYVPHLQKRIAIHATARRMEDLAIRERGRLRSHAPSISSEMIVATLANNSVHEIHSSPDLFAKVLKLEKVKYCSIAPSIYCLIDCLIDWLIDGWIDWLIVRYSIGWSFDWGMDGLIDWLIDWYSMGWSIDRSIEGSIDWLIGPF